MTPLVAYLMLFVAIGVGFILVHLVIGKLVRPAKPGPEKLTIYECGEPTVGSAWVQFDLRYYVVALLFVIFDVEVAFFFPWAEVFGKANALRLAEPAAIVSAEGTPTAAANAYLANLNDLAPPGKKTETLTAEIVTRNQSAAARLAWVALFDILVFFGVLLVGFAYLWKRGDLAWVRTVSDRPHDTLPRSVA